MRRSAVLLLLLIPLAACRGTQPYTRQDLAQVQQGWKQILPTFLAFRQAYDRGDTKGILTYFRIEQHQCRLVDVIDKRDTIDPNVNLFLASATLDGMCNGIESAYVGWAQTHHFPYDKSIIPARQTDAFTGADEEIQKGEKYLRHPAALS